MQEKKNVIHCMVYGESWPNPENNSAEEDNVSFEMRSLCAQKRRQNKQVGYVGVKKILATLSLVEREFSTASLWSLTAGTGLKQLH